VSTRPPAFALEGSQRVRRKSIKDVKDTPIIRGVRNYLEGTLAQKQMVRKIHPSLSGEANGKLRNTHGRIS
jgi:hypothetical protein